MELFSGRDEQLDLPNSKTYVECCHVNVASKNLVHYKHNS